MPIKVELSIRFKSRLRRLSRKYPSVIQEVERLAGRLEKGEQPGRRYRRISAKVFRARLPNRSARTGKSGGFRVAYLVDAADNILLLSICARNDCRDLEEETIRRLLIAEGL